MGIDWTRPGLFRSVFYFLLLGVLFRVRAHTGIDPVDLQPDILPLGTWFVRFFTEHPVWNEAVIAVLSLLNAFYITRILSQNLIYLERTYVPALIYGMIALGYAVSQQTPVMLAAASLFIFALDNLIRSYRRENHPGYFLHASVALGLMPLLYAPAVVLGVLLPVGLVLFKQNWRGAVTAVTGYLLPLFFCSYVLWGMGGDFGETARQIGARLTAPAAGGSLFFRMQLWDYALAGLLVLLTVVALVHLFTGRTSMRRRSVRGHTLFIWTLVLVAGMTAFPTRSLDLLPVAAVPLAALIPACFNRRSGWRPNLLYALMLGSVILYNLRFLL